MTKPLFLQKALTSIKEFFSPDRVLWLWAVCVTAGMLLFYLFAGFIPGMGKPLTFYQWWEDDLDRAALEQICEEFETVNPGIKVKLVKASAAEIKERLGTTEEEAKKARIEIPDVVSAEGIWLDEKPQALAAAEQVISFISPLYYNITLLEQAGYDRPPKTQTDFFAYVQSVASSAPGVSGAALALAPRRGEGGGASQILAWIWAGGLSATGGLAGTTGIAETGIEGFDFSSRTVTETLSFINNLKPFLYGDPFTLTEDQMAAAFAEGKIALMITSIGRAQKIAMGEIQFGITTVPSPSMGKPAFALSSWYAGISAACKRQEEARLFLDFLVKKAPQIGLAAYAVPGSGERNADLYGGDGYYAKAWDMYDSGEMIREVYGDGKVPALNEIIYDEIKNMFGGKSPEETAKAIQARWEAL